MTQPRTDLTCTVCRRHRATLRPRRSKLLTDITLFLCNECFENKREPRFAVILVARKNGVGHVKDYIRNHRYYGDKIRAEELV
jgi:hypothetical protein